MSVNVTRTFNMFAAAPSGFPKYQYRPAGGSWSTATNGGVTQIGSSSCYSIDISLDPGSYAEAWDPGDGNLVSEVFTIATPQSGDSFARLGTPASTSIAADIATRSTYAGGPVASVTAAVTVGTITDKTGYSLATAPPTAAAVATAVASAMASAPVGSVNSPVTVGTVNDKTGYALTTAPPTAAAVATAVASTMATAPVGSVNAPVTIGTITDKAGYSLATPPPTAAAVATAVASTMATSPVGGVNSPVTVGTMNDKTGYALATPPPTAAAIAAATAAAVGDATTGGGALTFGTIVSASLRSATIALGDGSLPFNAIDNAYASGPIIRNLAFRTGANGDMLCPINQSSVVGGLLTVGFEPQPGVVEATEGDQVQIQ